MEYGESLMDHRRHNKFKCTLLDSRAKERNQICTQVCSLSFCFYDNWFWLLWFYPLDRIFSVLSHLTKLYNLGPQEKNKSLYSQRAYSNIILRETTTKRLSPVLFHCWTTQSASPPLALFSTLHRTQHFSHCGLFFLVTYFASDWLALLQPFVNQPVDTE